MSCQFIPDDPSVTLATRFLPRLDSDAAAGIAAAIAAGGSLTGAQQSACNEFILGLKANSLWTRFAGLYLFVGGTAGAHAINWKQPGTYNVTWYNSPTHDANGVTGNGTNAYGDTNALASTVCPQDDAHISVYSRTASPPNNNRLISGTSRTAGTRRLEILSNSGVTWTLGLNNDSAFGPTGNCAAFLCGSRTGATASHMRRNTNVGTSAVASVGAVGVNLLFLARRDDATTDQFSAANIAFASFGAGMSTAETATLNTLVIALQTALGRNV